MGPFSDKRTVVPDFRFASWALPTARPGTSVIRLRGPGVTGTSRFGWWRSEGPAPHTPRDIFEPEKIGSYAAASIHFHADARDHAGLVRAEEGGGIAKVFGVREAAQRDGGEKFRADLGRVLAHEAFEQRRFACHRVECVHPDAVGGEFDRHGAGRGDHPALGGVVPVQPWARRNTGGGGDVEDVS